MSRTMRRRLIPSSTAATVRCTAWPSRAVCVLARLAGHGLAQERLVGVSDGVTVSATAGGPEAAGRGLASAVTVSCAP